MIDACDHFLVRRVRGSHNKQPDNMSSSRQHIIGGAGVVSQMLGRRRWEKV